MRIILVVGKSDKLARQLYASFAEKGHTTVLARETEILKMRHSRQNPLCFFIVQGERLSKYFGVCPDIIIIEEAPAWKGRTIQRMANSWIIVDGQNPEGVEAAALTGGKVISCGLRHNSTLFISSLEEDSLTFSLQRRLKTLFQEEVEEQDKIMKRIKDLDEFGHGALLCTFLLCEKGATGFS